MSLKEEVELLRRIPMFAQVEPAKLKLLAFASERLTFAPSQELFHQGDMADAAYIIVDGDAEVILETPKGPIRVAQMTKNDLIGEIGILLDQPRNATVKGMMALRVLSQLKKAGILLSGFGPFSTFTGP